MKPSDSRPTTITYRPDDRLRAGTIEAARHIVGELVRHREHVETTFRQDFRSMYTGTVLGVVWNFVLPLAPIFLYMLLAQRGVLPVFDGVNPSSYVAFGGAIWFFLISCVQQPIMIIESRNAEVMKTAIPFSAMILAGFGHVLFELIVRLAVVALVILATDSSLEWTALLLPVVLIPAVLLFLGFGLILGIANIIYRDIGRVVSIVLQYGLFVSGVIFPLSSLPFSDVLRFNPFYYFIEQARIFVFRGIPADPVTYCLVSLVAIGLFLLACRVFFAMEHRVRGIS